MTTDQAATAALAIRDGQTEWNPAQLAAFRQLGIDEAPEADRAVFFHVCQTSGLDPFANQITMIKRGGKWGIQTRIDGYRAIARDAARRDGVTLRYDKTIWYDGDEGEHRIWIRREPPAGASVTVYKDGEPFTGDAAYAEFLQRDKNGDITEIWRTKPAHQTAKCAEAQALRKAFPRDLAGIRITEETARDEPQITVTQVTPPAPERRREPREGSVAALRQAIRAEFDRIGLEDHEERGIYVNRLANKPADAPLTDLEEADLRFALDSLKECEDLAALVDLCAVEAS